MNLSATEDDETVDRITSVLHSLDNSKKHNFYRFYQENVCCPDDNTKISSHRKIPLHVSGLVLVLKCLLF